MFKPIRCSTEKATPYLRKQINYIEVDRDSLAVDLGCGNGRNSKFLMDYGFKNVIGFDKADDALNQLDLGKDIIPIENNFCGLILCNYIMMFLTNEERLHLATEINRIAKSHCHLFVEMFEAKNSIPFEIKDIRNLFDWETIHQSKDRFILRKK